jgi:hypothetical protein
MSVVQAEGWYAVMNTNGVEHRELVICWAVVDEGRRVSGLMEVNKEIVRCDRQGGFQGYEQAIKIEMGSGSFDIQV